MKLSNMIYDIYDECDDMITLLISNQKNNIGSLNKVNNMDNNKFYESLFYNSTYYLKNSLLIRKKKLYRDINNLYEKLLNDNKKYYNDKDFNKILLNIQNKFKSILLKDNNNELSWIKDDYLIHLNWWVDKFALFGKYHYFISKKFLEYVKLEEGFYNYTTPLTQDQRLSSENIHCNIQFILDDNIKKEVFDDYSQIVNNLEDSDEVENDSISSLDLKYKDIQTFLNDEKIVKVSKPMLVEKPVNKKQILSKDIKNMTQSEDSQQDNIVDVKTEINKNNRVDVDIKVKDKKKDSCSL